MTDTSEQMSAHRKTYKDRFAGEYVLRAMLPTTVEGSLCEVGFAVDDAVMLHTMDTTEQVNNYLTESDMPENMECRSKFDPAQMFADDDKRCHKEFYRDLR